MGRLIPNKKQEARSLELLKKYGPITLLFSWLPIVGDGFCLGAGWLRINFWRSFLLILLGKFVRYLSFGSGFAAYVFLSWKTLKEDR